MNTTEYEAHARYMHEFSKLRVQQLYDFNDPNYVWYKPVIDPTADAYTVLVPIRPKFLICGANISLYIPKYIDKITLCATIDNTNMTENNCYGIDIYMYDSPDIPLDFILNQVHNVPNGSTYEELEKILQTERNIPNDSAHEMEEYTRIPLGEPYILGSMWINASEDFIFYTERIFFKPENLPRTVIYTNFNNEHMYTMNNIRFITHSKYSQKINPYIMPAESEFVELIYRDIIKSDCDSLQSDIINTLWPNGID